MSVYPIKIDRISQRHNGPTGKEYHILTLASATGRAVMITRYAKKGAWGQLQSEMFDSVKAMNTARVRKSHQKFERGGYDIPIQDRSDIATNFEELQSKLGAQYWASLATPIKFLTNIQPECARDPDKGEFVARKDGSFGFEREAKSGGLIIKTEAELHENDETWGMF